MDGTVKLKEVVTGPNAFVAGGTYTIVSKGGSTLQAGATNLDDASAIARAVSGIATNALLTEGQTFTVDADASVAEMAHLNSLTQGITFTSASEAANDIAGPNKDAKFNLAHLPSDAVVVKTLGGASQSGRAGTAGLEADKTYIIRAITSDETNYFGTAGEKAPLVQVGASAIFRQAGGNTAITAGNMTIGDVVVMSSAVAGAGLDGTMRVDEVNTGSNRLLAGHEYEIVKLGNSSGAVNIASYTTDAGAIGRASSDIADSSTLVEGSKFTVDADITTTNLAYLNALTEGMTFRMTTDVLTKDIEAMQGLVNTARVQAGSQYAAIESAVDYTTDLTAQYELGYNTVNDVNFSMETAHLARNQILQQAATAMLAQANQGQQSLLQLISR
jgi:flagellin-like hook-associated protein FlgL